MLLLIRLMAGKIGGQKSKTGGRHEVTTLFQLWSCLLPIVVRIFGRLHIPIYTSNDGLTDPRVASDLP